MEYRPIFLVLFLLHSIHSLKFLVYNPIFARSHLTFIGSLSDALIDAGHQVHVLAPIIDSRFNSYGTTKATIIHVPQSNSSLKFESEVEVRMSRNFWLSESVSDAMEEMKSFRDAWHGQCNFTLHYEGLIERLKSENYDAAFSEPICMCGYALFNHIGIDNYAIALSIASSEGSFDITGAPSFPSYIPASLGVHGEQMNFVERMHNLFNYLVIYLFFPGIRDPFDDMFKQRFGDEAIGVEDMLRKSSLYFVNSEPLIDFPKILTHKLIDIGGISIYSGHNSLNETWSSILDRRQVNVLISFGTVAKSYLMPDEYKKSIIETVKHFPDVTFIWKYEKPEDRISEGIDNLIESTWVPQNDMLYDSRLSLFITHCGQGSTIEAVTAGIPLIVIPVLGDQQRNAQVIKRIGTGIKLEKSSLINSDELISAMSDILDNDQYAKKARLVGEMIRNRPFSAREIFVRNMEFMAKFGPLRQLDHYGQQLNFIQYYLIDVFAFLAFVVIVSFISLLFGLRWIAKRVIRKVKTE